MPANRPIDPGLSPLDALLRQNLRTLGFVETEVASAAGPQILFAAGSGQSICFLHGTGHHAGSWHQTAAALLKRGRFRILIPDLAGHGASAPTAGPITMEILLAGLDGIMQEAVPTRATLVGNSLGGWLAMTWASLHPGRVDRIVGVDTSGISGVNGEITLTPKTRDEARRVWQAAVDKSNWELPDVFFDELIRKAREGALGRVDALSVAPFLMDGVLSKFTVPVDLIWGESDRLLPLDYAKRLQSGLPNATLVSIPKCGHIPQLECPDRFNEALLKVLDKGGQTA
jgi:pimeloyl-ACP methyl ester carboxylesterase